MKLTGATETVLVLVRHGESASNAGLATRDPSAIELTTRGLEQAEQLAQSWPEDLRPSRIVTSPFLRARQTALPLALRFKLDEAVEMDETVREFTYLSMPPLAQKPADRYPAVEAYWATMDPELAFAGAESFRAFLERTCRFAKRAAQTPGTSVVFSHGLFMSLFKMLAASPRCDPDGRFMAAVDQARRLNEIANTEWHTYRWQEDRWQLTGLAPPTFDRR